MPSSRTRDVQPFPTTHWTLIGRAGDGQEQLRREALNDLLTRYWPALKAHLVIRKRIDPNEADDFVQGFIESKILERNLVAAADSGRGRFRTLLATALDNYVANQIRDRGAQKRRADRAASLDDEALAPQAASTDSPHEALDVAWARAVLAEILARMEKECRQSARGDLWGVFEGRIVVPILENTQPQSYEQLMDRLGFRSPAQASNALITAKRMFARIMRAVVGEYARDREDIDCEIRDLYHVFASGR